MLPIYTRQELCCSCFYRIGKLCSVAAPQPTPATYSDVRFSAIRHAKAVLDLVQENDSNEKSQYFAPEVIQLLGDDSPELKEMLMAATAIHPNSRPTAAKLLHTTWRYVMRVHPQAFANDAKNAFTRDRHHSAAFVLHLLKIFHDKRAA